MGSLRILALAGALASVTASQTFAGDLPPVTAIPDAPMEAPSYADDSGIYLRGDVGAGWTDAGSMSVCQNGDCGENIPGIATYETSNIGADTSYFAGAGVGYAFNSWLRFDVTGELRGGSTVYGRDYITFPGHTAAAPNDLYNNYTGSLSSIVALANAYVDIGTFCQLGCITPYVGGGVGYTWNSVSGLVDNGTRTTGGVSSATHGFGNSSSEGDLAWALMAGFAYKVNDKLTLDLGYRYLNLGDGPQTVFVDPTNLGATNTVQFTDLSSHDIRMGMRWTLGNSDCCGTPEQPLTRKY